MCHPTGTKVPAIGRHELENRSIVNANVTKCVYEINSLPAIFPWGICKNHKNMPTTYVYLSKCTLAP